MAASTISFTDSDARGEHGYTAADVAGIFVRNARLIGACTVLMSAIGLGMYQLQVPAYKSTARVLVQTDQMGAPSFLSGIAAYRDPLVAEPAARKLETEMALILNRQNASEVVRALGIDVSQLPTTPVARATQWLLNHVREWRGSVTLQSEDARNDLVDRFLKGVSVEPVRSAAAETTSNVLEISIETTDPALSEKALHGMLDAYLTFGARQSQEAGSATMQAVQQQVEQARTELRRIDDAIVALSVKESERATLAASVATAQGRGAGASERGNAVDSAASRMATQLVELQARLDELQQTFTDETQSVQNLKRQVAEARARLADHVRTNARQSAEFGRLERQRSLAQERYTELRRKFDQIKLYTDLAPAGNEGRVVVDPPDRPDAKEGRKKPIYAVTGPMTGLLLGALLAALREVMFPRLHGRRDVERWLGVPLLGSLPPLDSLDGQTPRQLERMGPA